MFSWCIKYEGNFCFLVTPIAFDFIFNFDGTRNTHRPLIDKCLVVFESEAKNKLNNTQAFDWNFLDTNFYVDDPAISYICITECPKWDVVSWVETITSIDCGCDSMHIFKTWAIQFHFLCAIDLNQSEWQRNSVYEKTN